MEQKSPQQKVTNSPTKERVASPYYGLADAATLLGTTVKELAKTDAINRCKLFPRLTRIQHVKSRPGHRGSAVLFVKTQVDALAAKLQEPVKLELARPMDVDSDTIAELLAMGRAGEQTLRHMGVRI